MKLFFGILIFILIFILYAYNGNSIINDVSNKNIDKAREEIIREVIEELERRQEQKKEEIIREVIEELERRQKQERIGD